MVEKTSESGRVFDVKYGTDDDTFTVSTIVPVFGAEKTLRQALNSLLNQNMDDLEIVIVNDASPDNCAEIIEGYAILHPNVTVVTHRENAGYGASMNDGIQAARGDWIAILEPDDYILPDMYRSMLNAATKYDDLERIDIIKTPYIREVRKEGVERGDTPEGLLQCSYRHRIKPRYQPFTMRDEKASHLLRHHPSIWSAIYLKKFLDMRHIKFVEYPGAGWADNEFFYETLLQALDIVYLDEPFYVYREETDREFEEFTRKNPDLAMERWHSMQDIIERLHIRDENILRSHISKGFTYLDGLVKTFGDEVAQNSLVKKMFERINENLVQKEKLINPKLKELYINSIGVDWDLTEDRKIHKKELVREAGYAMRNNGPAFMVRQVVRYVTPGKSKRG